MTRNKEREREELLKLRGLTYERATRKPKKTVRPDCSGDKPKKKKHKSDPELGKLRQALLVWGDHKSFCPIRTASRDAKYAETCYCGWAEFQSEFLWRKGDNESE